MHQEMIMAGMGGQGVLLIGQLLAQAAMQENKNVVWLPSYGPETRGGMTSCTVIVSTEEIGSPVIASPEILIALTQPLLDKMAPCTKKNGMIVVNTSLAELPEYRSDCKLIGVPANNIADEIGNSKAANMVILGAFIQIAKTVDIESIKASLSSILPERNHKHIPLNCLALDKGAEYAAKHY